MNPTSTFLRAATRKSTDKLNILTAPTHESYETNLCQTGHNFYAFRTDGIKDWNSTYRTIPENYYLLPKNKLPNHLAFDLVLSQNKFGQFQALSKIASRLHLPIASIEHTMPTNDYLRANKENWKNMRGTTNMFISEFSMKEWGWDLDEAEVITHGIDANLFCPKDEKQPIILSVVNDFINRGPILGFDIWKYVVSGLPHAILGDTEGLSKPSESIHQLIQAYQSSLVFLNTSIMSPIPSVCLEAAACGCIIVSTDNCAIPDFFTHNKNAYLTNDPHEMKDVVIDILDNPSKYAHLGLNARKMIKEKCNLSRFVNQWNDIFNRTAIK